MPSKFFAVVSLLWLTLSKAGLQLLELDIIKTKQSRLRVVKMKVKFGR